jgi:hypothetical protein
VFQIVQDLLVGGGKNPFVYNIRKCFSAFFFL